MDYSFGAATEFTWLAVPFWRALIAAAMTESVVSRAFMYLPPSHKRTSIALQAIVLDDTRAPDTLALTMMMDVHWGGHMREVVGLAKSECKAWFAVPPLYKSKVFSQIVSNCLPLGPIGLPCAS